MFLDDVYGEQAILADGVVPRRLINSCEHFHRQASGIRPPNGVRIHVAGIDLIRDENDELRVLEDNVRSPSGVSYVMENRRTMARVFPTSSPPTASARYATIRAICAGHWPGLGTVGAEEPNIVLLTPASRTRHTSSTPARSADGYRAGRGPRPRLPRQRRLHAHHRRPDPRRRHLPAHR